MGAWLGWMVENMHVYVRIKAFVMGFLPRCQPITCYLINCLFICLCCYYSLLESGFFFFFLYFFLSCFFFVFLLFEISLSSVCYSCFIDLIEYLIVIAYTLLIISAMRDILIASFTDDRHNNRQISMAHVCRGGDNKGETENKYFSI